MKIVYIAHPISGDIQGNIKKILGICEKIHKTEKNVIPFAPYLTGFHYLNDEIQEDRELGIQTNLEFFKRKSFDEIWVYGDKISNGVQQEINLANEVGIPVIFKNKITNDILLT